MGTARPNWCSRVALAVRVIGVSLGAGDFVAVGNCGSAVSEDRESFGFLLVLNVGVVVVVDIGVGALTPMGWVKTGAPRDVVVILGVISFFPAVVNHREVLVAMVLECVEGCDVGVVGRVFLGVVHVVCVPMRSSPVVQYLAKLLQRGHIMWCVVVCF